MEQLFNVETMSMADLIATREYVLQSWHSRQNSDKILHAVCYELDKRLVNFKTPEPIPAVPAAKAPEETDFHFPAWLGTHGWKVELGTSAKRFTRTGYELDIFFSGTDNEVFSIRHISDSSKFWVTLFGCAKLPNNAIEAEIFMSKFNL